MTHLFHQSHPVECSWEEGNLLCTGYACCLDRIQLVVDTPGHFAFLSYKGVVAWLRPGVCIYRMQNHALTLPDRTRKLVVSAGPVDGSRGCSYPNRALQRRSGS